MSAGVSKANDQQVWPCTHPAIPQRAPLAIYPGTLPTYSRCAKSEQGASVQPVPHPARPRVQRLPPSPRPQCHRCAPPAKHSRDKATAALLLPWRVPSAPPASVEHEGGQSAGHGRLDLGFAKSDTKNRRPSVRDCARSERCAAWTDVIRFDLSGLVGSVWLFGSVSCPRYTSPRQGGAGAALVTGRTLQHCG